MNDCVSECIVKRKLNIKKSGVRPPNFFLYISSLEGPTSTALSFEKASQDFLGGK
jgi:hypothetical protein